MLKFLVGPNRNALFPDTPFLYDHMVFSGAFQFLFTLTIHYAPVQVKCIVKLVLECNSGPMVWYQKFEYALGHWMQKATEHVLGCVLCSPGCFSLFRGSAIMDDNVMKKYTTKSTEASHFIQYDQGEHIFLHSFL